MKAILITTSVFLVMMIGTLGYVIGLGQAIDNQVDSFRTGQVLYPDYVHPKDTLIVRDAAYLNECMNDGKLKTDGDIMEILNETCVKNIVDPHEYQIDITEDSTYIYDGNIYVGSIPYDSTQ